MQSIYSLLASRQTSLSRANWLNIFQQIPIQKQYDLLEYFAPFDTIKCPYWAHTIGCIYCRLLREFQLRCF